MKKQPPPNNQPKKQLADNQKEFIGQDMEVEKILAELELVNYSFRSSLKLRGYLENPRIPFREKQKTIHDLFKDYISARTYDFVFLLLRTNALSSLSDILKRYKLTRADTGILEIEVKTSLPLTNEEKERLSQIFTRKLQKPVSIKNIIDPEIIGGMVVKTGDLMIDASLKTRIQGLLKNLKQG
ncbi:MAG: ATP synthase F1 subunit delta [bacterium]